MTEPPAAPALVLLATETVVAGVLLAAEPVVTGAVVAVWMFVEVEAPVGEVVVMFAAPRCAQAIDTIVTETARGADLSGPRPADLSLVDSPIITAVFAAASTRSAEPCWPARPSPCSTAAESGLVTAPRWLPQSLCPGSSYGQPAGWWSLC